jgi:putative zinc finger protein
MNRCEETLKAVTHLAAGEIDPAARRELEAHLRVCPVCSHEATDLRLVLQAIQKADTPDPGESYWSAFDGRLRQRIVRSGFQSRRRRALVLAAAAVLVAGLVLVAIRRDRDERDGGPAAEALLEDLLRRAATGPEGIPAAQAILDEMVPGDDLEMDDSLRSLSPEERESLARDLSGTEG